VREERVWYAANMCKAEFGNPEEFVPHFSSTFTTVIKKEI
jgi:hypothetical protein